MIGTITKSIEIPERVNVDNVSHTVPQVTPGGFPDIPSERVFSDIDSRDLFKMIAFASRDPEFQRPLPLVISAGMGLSAVGGERYNPPLQLDSTYCWECRTCGT